VKDIECLLRERARNGWRPQKRPSNGALTIIEKDNSILPQRQLRDNIVLNRFSFGKRFLPHDRVSDYHGKPMERRSPRPAIFMRNPAMPSKPTADRPTEDALNIEGRPGGPIETVSYLLTDRATGAWALVDPTQGVLETWSDRLKDRRPPQAILITHAHFDHVGGVAEVARRYPGASVWVHPDSAPLLEDGERNGSQWLMIPYEPARATHLYREGDEVAIGDSRLRVIETPGHCPGSVSLLCGRHLIVGDVLFRGGVGRWDLPGAGYDVLAASIRDKVMRLADDVIVYPGHGPTTTIGEERRNNPIVRQMLAGARLE
jgi:glyoxylase-like metal-dependent hydrolase (beta-lactamase superfamily II)